MVKGKLTAYVTLIISKAPFRTHMETFLWIIKLKMADWMAAKNDIIAVLEYSNGYFLPILACMRNHEDHKSEPAPRNTEPTTHLFVLLAEIVVLVWFVR